MLSSDTGCWLHLLCRPTEDVSAVLLEHIHILIVHNKFPTRITVLETKPFSAKNIPGTWAELDPPVTAQKNKMSCLRFVRVFARTVRIKEISSLQNPSGLGEVASLSDRQSRTRNREHQRTGRLFVRRGATSLHASSFVTFCY